MTLFRQMLLIEFSHGNTAQMCYYGHFSNLLLALPTPSFIEFGFINGVDNVN